MVHFLTLALLTVSPLTIMVGVVSKLEDKQHLRHLQTGTLESQEERKLTTVLILVMSPARKMVLFLPFFLKDIIYRIFHYY